VLIDRDGRAVYSRLWPGKTCDVTTLIPVIDGLGWGFDIVRTCVIADRTMITAETVAELEALYRVPQSRTAAHGRRRSGLDPRRTGAATRARRSHGW
jgi:hypothetical protein